jgi:hypothetical protein
MRALALVLFLAASTASAQTFVKILDPSNPIATDVGPQVGYPGACVDRHRRQRPAPTSGRPRRPLPELGGGMFDKPPGAQGAVIPADSAARGPTTINDGDADLFLAARGTSPGPGSALYRNDSPPGTLDGPFTKVMVGAMADTAANGGWSAAWGDYDEDNRLDVVVAGLPALTTVSGNHLLHALSGDLFEHDSTTQVDDATAPFTVPSWSDFDEGRRPRPVHRIGARERPVRSRLLLPQFHRRPARATRLDRMLGSPWTDARDGQLWNWIDYDNDGDLDAFITNYGGGFPGTFNELWRNDGGTLVKMTQALVGTIVSDRAVYLASVWGDLDNDGDLDVLLTTDAGGRKRYYRNDVDSTGFFRVTVIGTSTQGLTGEAAASAASRSATMTSTGSSMCTSPRRCRACGATRRRIRTTGPSFASSARRRIAPRSAPASVSLATIKGQPRWQIAGDLGAELVQRTERSRGPLRAARRDVDRHGAHRVAERPRRGGERRWGRSRVHDHRGTLGPTPTRIAFASARPLEGAACVSRSPARSIRASARPSSGAATPANGRRSARLEGKRERLHLSRIAARSRRAGVMPIGSLSPTATLGGRDVVGAGPGVGVSAFTPSPANPPGSGGPLSLRIAPGAAAWFEWSRQPVAALFPTGTLDPARSRRPNRGRRPRASLPGMFFLTGLSGRRPRWFRMSAKVVLVR